MCNDYEQHIRWAEYCAFMQALKLGVPAYQSELDLPQADDIKINDMATVMRAAGDDIELSQMNFSFPPSGRGGLVFNFRSEGRHFAGSRRCLIPASAFFEFIWTLIDDAIWKVRGCVLSGRERRVAIALS
jgi:putative SOS response-associated peptidase YedK